MRACRVKHSIQLSIIKTYPQLIGYDTQVFEYFKEQAHLCSMDINLTWPQTGGKIPQINLNDTTGLPIGQNTSASISSIGLNPALQRSKASKGLSVLRRSGLKAVLGVVNKSNMLMKRGSRRLMAKDLKRREALAAEWIGGKRDLSGRANGTIDPWYGCFLGDELRDYALNFSLPWSA